MNSSESYSKPYHPVNIFSEFGQAPVDALRTTVCVRRGVNAIRYLGRFWRVFNGTPVLRVYLKPEFDLGSIVRSDRWTWR